MARVLIVDDTDIVRKALEKAVQRMGHSTVSTSDSVEALAMALKNPPDLALVDYRMPNMDGAELWEEMRTSLGERCPKVLFVSATPPERGAQGRRARRGAGGVREEAVPSRRPREARRGRPRAKP